MNARVLIVDDEPEALELLAFKLAGEGFEVLKAASGLEGLRKARCEAPAVIVLDVMLPDLNGLCVCEILGAQPSTRDIPVVIFSALDPPAKFPRAIKRVPQWLKKGADLQSLGTRVRDAVAEHAGLVKSRLRGENDPDCELIEDS